MDKRSRKRDEKKKIYKFSDRYAKLHDPSKEADFEKWMAELENMNFMNEPYDEADQKEHPEKYCNAPDRTARVWRFRWLPSHGGKRGSPSLSTPETRKWYLVVDKDTHPSACSTCRHKYGRLTCARCNAVTYCSVECQKADWNKHKSPCGQVKEKLGVLKKMFHEMKDACYHYHHGEQEEVVDHWIFRYRMALSDAEKQTLIEERMKMVFDSCTGGGYKWVDSRYDMALAFYDSPEKELGIYLPVLGTHGPDMKQLYFNLRFQLTNAYMKTALASKSKRAWRLAASNIIDLLQLSFRHHGGEHSRNRFSAWMVAGDMDQLALNYLVFVEKRRLQSEDEEAMVWMDIDDQDIESYEYVRLFTTRSSTEKRDIEHKWETANAIHCFLLIALIKIKRLQQLFTEWKENESPWRTFMMGLHQRAGSESTLQKLRGNVELLMKVKSHLKVHNLEVRIQELSDQIARLLSEVKERNPILLQTLFSPGEGGDPRQGIPHINSDIPEVRSDELDDYEYVEWGEFGSIPYNATFAWQNNMAWVTSESYKKIVEHFLRTGKVTLVSSERNFPVEGFAMAAFDSNPSKVRSEEFAKLSAYYGAVDFSVATEPWVVNIPKDPTLDLPWCGLCACDWNELNECGCVLFTNLYNLEDKKPLYKGIAYRDPDRVLETPRLPKEKSRRQPRTPQIRAEDAIRSKKLNVKYLTSGGQMDFNLLPKDMLERLSQPGATPVFPGLKPRRTKTKK